jgi:anti-sigma regulatory factor (Ser/Thr protein kinase)/GNAT superfamily N-acetyltransferase
MQPRCDYSRLTMPNNRAYIPVACAYVDECAQRLGFEEDDRRMIVRAVSEAASNVIEHAFEPSEGASFEISCERVALGLKIVVKDLGLPFDPRELEQIGLNERHPRSGHGLGIMTMKESMDEVEFHNLGPEGKETVLIKYLRSRGIGDYLQACELEPYAPRPAERSKISEPEELTIRPMHESEALEIAKSVYKAYGYTYAFEPMYFPERLIELNRSGRMFSAVAVTAENEIAGHLALVKHDDEARIAEMGRAVVKPEFRSRGIFTQLTNFIVEKAESEGLMGLFGEAVTLHTYSQQVGRAAGLKDCALLLGFLPQTESFKGIREELPQRESVLIHFRYLHEPPQATLFPPVHHLEMIFSLYKNLGASPVIAATEESHDGVTETESWVRTNIAGPKGFARIEVVRFSSKVVSEVKARLKDLCFQDFEVIHLYLDLTNPQTYRFTEDFEQLGFFFAGILPGGCAAGDALILQYLNNVPMDYTKIKVKSENAMALLEYVRQHDPNLL